MNFVVVLGDQSRTVSLGRGGGAMSQELNSILVRSCCGVVALSPRFVLQAASARVSLLIPGFSNCQGWCDCFVSCCFHTGGIPAPQCVW